MSLVYLSLANSRAVLLNGNFICTYDERMDEKSCSLVVFSVRNNLMKTLDFPVQDIRIQEFEKWTWEKVLLKLNSTGGDVQTEKQHYQLLINRAVLELIEELKKEGHDDLTDYDLDWFSNCVPPFPLVALRAVLPHAYFKTSDTELFSEIIKSETYSLQTAVEQSNLDAYRSYISDLFVELVNREKF